jgi:hypothetical protein
MKLDFKSKIPLFAFAILNFLIIFLVNQVSDLPVWVGNWEAKATRLASFANPLDNFYPPGGAILLIPFLGFKPHYEIAVFFYFTISSILYFLICKSMIKDRLYFLIALCGFSLNPYLIWLVNSSQDTVFELFLLLSGFSLILARRYLYSLFPLYLLCLTRPAYWVFFLLLPFAVKQLKISGRVEKKIPSKLLVIPFLFLLITMSINQVTFKDAALAGEAGMTAHFGHNKYWYLSMPKFDSDVFLSTGGNMNTEKFLIGKKDFAYVSNEEFRAALIYITENPKSLFLNTLQKIDTYFFSVQKNPQLSGEYYLSDDQKNIVIGENRESWTLISGSYVYFLHRSLLLIFTIAAVTLLITTTRFRSEFLRKPNILFCLPYLFGSVAAVAFFTESRYKIVSELLLIPLILSIFDNYKTGKFNDRFQRPKVGTLPT